MSAARQPIRGSLDAVLDAIGDYLHLPSVDHVLFALAVAVTARLDGNPCWGLIVGPPSSGKTEAIRALEAVADAHVDEITAAGLLGWLGSPSKGHPVGLLTRIGDRALATIADLSPLLAMSDRGGRDTVFALLRRAYDGEVTRDLGSAPRTLHWSGRLTLLAAVTPAIDSYLTHSDALGPRWLYLRMPQSSSSDRRATTRAARQHADGLAAHRATVRRRAQVAVESAIEPARAFRPGSALACAIEDAAIVACLCRTPVERSGYGSREITSVPEPEEPPRLAGQLFQLARGLAGLGVPATEIERIVRTAALDSLPVARRRTLTVLALGEPLTASQIAREARIDRKLAAFALEELAAIGICTIADGGRGDPRPARLVGEDGKLIGHVLGADQLGTRSRTPTPNPPSKDPQPTSRTNASPTDARGQS